MKAKWKKGLRIETLYSPQEDMTTIFLWRYMDLILKEERQGNITKEETEKISKSLYKKYKKSIT